MLSCGDQIVISVSVVHCGLDSLYLMRIAGAAVHTNACCLRDNLT